MTSKFEPNFFDFFSIGCIDFLWLFFERQGSVGVWLQSTKSHYFRSNVFRRPNLAFRLTIYRLPLCIYPILCRCESCFNHNVYYNDATLYTFHIGSVISKLDKILFSFPSFIATSISQNMSGNHSYWMIGDAPPTPASPSLSPTT